MNSNFEMEFESIVKPNHLILGRIGERLAADYLIHQKYRIVATNFSLPIGQSRNGRPITGEIDLVAYDESSKPFILAFIEVKTRTSSDIATPEAAVDLRKQRHIIRAARLYRRLMAVEEEPYRFDVVSILAGANNKAHISLLRDYFTEQRYASIGRGGKDL